MTMLKELEAKIREELRADVRAELLPEVTDRAEREVRTKLLKEFAVEREHWRSQFEIEKRDALARLDFASRRAEQVVSTRDGLLGQMKGEGHPFVFWSTYKFAQSEHIQGIDRRLFTTPLGMLGQGFPRPLSIAETNLRESGRFPAGSGGCRVKRIDVELYGSRADRDLFRRNCVLAMDLLQSIHELRPLGVLTWKDEGTFSGATAWAPAAIRGLHDAWLIERESNFSLVARIGQGLTEFDGAMRPKEDLTMRVTLRGIRTAKKNPRPSLTGFEGVDVTQGFPGTRVSIDAAAERMMRETTTDPIEENPLNDVPDGYEEA